MEQHDAGLVQPNEGAGSRPEGTTFFGSGLHESLLTTEPEVPGCESPLSEEPECRPDGGSEVEPPVEQQQAFIAPDGQVHQIPPDLIGPDGKMLPLTEKLLAKLRGKYFTVRHVLLDCGHRLDMINEPANNCESCWFQFFNTHGKLIEVTHEIYVERGKEAINALRGKKYTKMYLRFMATVQHFLAEQKKQEINDGDQNISRLGDGTTCEEAGGEGRTSEAADGSGEDSSGRSDDTIA